jgi:DNA-directed RNA polymerase specialized sigma24 family protein
MSNLGMFVDLSKELHKGLFPKVKKHHKLRYSESRTRKRLEFLNKYSRDIERMSRMWLKRLNTHIDPQDVIQEVRTRALTSRVWYSDKWYSTKYKHGSKATTFLYSAIRNTILGMISKEPREIPFSQINNTCQFLKNGYYNELEIPLDEKVVDKNTNFDSVDGFMDIQKELQNKKPLLSYIFYGYLMGYRNSDIARALAVTEMFIGIEWNKFVHTFRRFRCRALPFFQRKFSTLAA